MTRRDKWMTGFAVTLVVFLFAQAFGLFDGSMMKRSGHGAANRCRAEMSGFIIGIKAYQTEYNRFPPEALTPAASRAPIPTRGKIFDTLHPDQNALQGPESNPRKINFYDPPLAKEKKRGLYFGENNESILADPWGTPYYFMVDVAGSATIPNPDPRDAGKNPVLQTTIIVFSAGPDKNPDTWEDNIMSWK